MTPAELAEAKARAETWLADPPLPGVVTRDNAQREDHMALDVVALLAEVERLRDELDHATAHDGDHLSKASRRMCETILRQAHAADEKVHQLTKERDELGRAFDGEVARRVARDEEISRLTTRRDELLATIARLSNELPFPDEAKGWTEQRAKLLAEIGTLKAEREEWKRRYNNAPAQEAYEAVCAELAELQESDSTAAQRYEADIDDNLPRYSIGEDCHGEPDEANYHERIEYAGEEIKRLTKENEQLRGWIAGLDAGLADASIAKQTAEAIAAWLEQQAATILAGPAPVPLFAQHRAAGLTDAVDCLRAGTWKERTNG